MVVDAAARFWDDLDFGDVSRTSLQAKGGVLQPSDIAVIHAPMPGPTLNSLAGRFVVGIAHQLLYDLRRPGYYDRAELLVPVSRHVGASLQRHGLQRVHATALYGVADLERGVAAGPIVAGALFDADARKPRDRVYSALSRARRSIATPRRYDRRAGLTLGVVSRLAPLKQFPALFQRLVPILTRHSDVNVEIFGSAVGYKSLAAMQDVLSPLGARVRFWGHQRDVAAAYRTLDYLLTGLPEREALGLNAIESCAAGTPVLAIAAPPFTETLRDGVTGFLYADPRVDGGTDFERVLAGIEAGVLRVDRDEITAHLEAFSFTRFAERVDAVMEDIATTARQTRPA